MSTFRVYGVTIELAAKKAEKYIDDLPDKLKPTTPAEYEAKLQELTRSYFDRMQPAPVGKPFDAPQFAYELITLAKKTTKSRELHVRVHVPKQNKDGSVVINKKTKKPVMTWARYEAEAFA